MNETPHPPEEPRAPGATRPVLAAYPNRETRLGHLPIQRALPRRERRLVGPWCFLDRFGPLAFANEKPMDVPPHPHIGLQTVSWLLEGEVLHTDSLGCEAVVRPGGVNVMTAGRGISHAEQTPPSASGRPNNRLSGIQLWVALPDAVRNMEPSFSGIAETPAFEPRGGLVRVFAGALGGVRSPAPHFSPLIGADVQVHPASEVEIELDPSFEHGLLLLEGECLFEGQPLTAGTLYVLAPGHSSAAFSSPPGGQLLLIGGPPWGEPLFSGEILMWWNFVARTPEEIAEARADWEAHRRFGEVLGYSKPRLSAPELTRIARPNPLS